MFYDESQGYNYSMILPGVSVSACHEQNRCMTTIRASAGSPAYHSLFSLRTGEDNKVVLDGTISSLVGFENGRVLSKSCLFRNKCGESLVTSSDEKSGNLLLWSVDSGEIVQKLSEVVEMGAGAIYDLRYRAAARHGC